MGLLGVLLELVGGLAEGLGVILETINILE